MNVYHGNATYCFKTVQNPKREQFSREGKYTSLVHQKSMKTGEGQKSIWFNDRSPSVAMSFVRTRGFEGEPQAWQGESKIN